MHNMTEQGVKTNYQKNGAASSLLRLTDQNVDATIFSFHLFLLSQDKLKLEYCQVKLHVEANAYFFNKLLKNDFMSIGVAGEDVALVVGGSLDNGVLA